MRTSLLKKRKLISAEEVEWNTELLIEILILLPPKSIFKFRCVSKRWNQIIADPLFRESYRSRASKLQRSGAGGRLLAFVQERSKFGAVGIVRSHPLLNILTIMQQDEQKFKPLPDGFGNFIPSLDGLFLCTDCKSRESEWRYHVVNPLTRKWVQLPRHTTPHKLYGVGLACKENMKELVPSFRVVGIVNQSLAERRSLEIETYSYETGRWATSTLVANEVLPEWLILVLVCKGVFHWRMLYCNTMVIYNSNREENCVHIIKLPERCKTNDCVIATRSSTDDLLWISSGHGNRWSSTGIIKFWKLPIDDYYSYKFATTIPGDQWILMHTIDITSLYNEMALLLKTMKRKFKETTRRSNHVIKMEALIPSNPVAAIVYMQQKMFVYNLESQSLELVRYRGRPYGKKRTTGWIPLIESLSLSSYGPLGSTYE